MKKLVAMLLLAAPMVAGAESQPAVLKADVHTVWYVSAVKASQFTTAQAWEGTQVVRLGDGTCQKVVHTDLHIEKSGDAQKAEYKETKSAVECPV
ncbi:hypothetical protein CJ026_009080 [Ralstonia pickettii]|uniref:hypothetical protein n=1 Tax=Ralstonia pickettii TaxID=329 RepID=UPI000BD9EA94|nr:hypothetical protein [Ralstonia pickettii]POH87041.1 hypothetical protein CJ026_009080 [Ralstonia pickettii]